ncbi:hypothetical protein [Cetobacterium sp.]|uniref:hypothetical protein n=1 Tax=Cetobacterium sp. TaxID=2071632 RepID=UPI002FCC7EE1
MKKLLIIISIILTNYLFSADITGQVYNLKKRGSSYQGTLEARVFSNKKESRIKIIPVNNIEILRVNGDKNENNVYSIKDKDIRIEFIYNSTITSIDEKINFGKVDYLDEVGKTEVLLGNIAVDFRKPGKIDLSVKGDMDFGIINPRVPKKGISSKKNPEITINLDIDKKDVGNTKLYFEYPEEVFMGDGQLVIKFENKRKSDFIDEVTEKGETLKVLGFIPKKQKTTEKIQLQGKLFSTVPQVKPGNYEEVVRIKAFYEYLDYSLENKEKNKKVVIRR